MTLIAFFQENYLSIRNLTESDVFLTQRLAFARSNQSVPGIIPAAAQPTGIKRQTPANFYEPQQQSKKFYAQQLNSNSQTFFPSVHAMPDLRLNLYFELTRKILELRQHHDWLTQTLLNSQNLQLATGNGYELMIKMQTMLALIQQIIPPDRSAEEYLTQLKLTNLYTNDIIAMRQLQDIAAINEHLKSLTNANGFAGLPKKL